MDRKSIEEPYNTLIVELIALETAIVDMCDIDTVELNALETAIVDMCDIDTVHAIQDRKKVIMKR